jgi:competence protein ComEC
LWLAIGAWVGVSVSESLSWGAYSSHGDAVGPAIAVGVLAVIAVLVMRGHALSVLVCAGLAAGLVCGSCYWGRWRTEVRAIAESRSSRWSAEAVSDPQPGRFGSRSTVRLAGGARAVCTWPAEKGAPEYGDVVEFFGRLRAPGCDEFGRIDHRTGTAGTIGARSVSSRGASASVRGLFSRPRRAANAMMSQVPGRGGALLTGLVTGDRRRLARTSVESDFRVTGLSHLIAVSGSHLVVVAAVCGWALRRTRMSRGAAEAVLLCALGGYVVFTGMQASALRACAMSAVAASSRLGFRRLDGLGSLSVVVLVLLCLWPPCAFDVGFRLSVLAVAGLLAFSGLAERWAEAALPRLLTAAAGPISMALVAQAATLPVSIPTFGMVSIVSPVANVAAVPLVSVALVGGVSGVMMGALAPSPARWTLMAAGAVANACAALAARLAAVPHASALVGGSAVLMGLGCALLAAWVWAAWPRPSPRVARIAAAAVVACALVLFAAKGSAETSVTMLDVGQGDAILLQSRGRRMLVDAGPNERALRRALTRSGVRELDWLIITHAHEDHLGGVAALEGAVRIRELGTASDAALEDEAFSRLAEKSRRRLLSAGDRVDLGELEVEVLWPPAGFEGDENASSVVLLVSRNGSRVLLTGDAESEVLQRLAAQGALGDLDAIKVGHHGSRSAVSPQVMAAARPEVALVSVGAGNRFGHPAPSTLQCLAGAGCAILRTDEDGDVRLEPSRGAFLVRCEPVAGAGGRVRH